MKKKVLVIVAHPDDETIWMGGTIIRNKKRWETTVICLTRRSDKDRKPKFLEACKILGVKGHIYDLDDTSLDKNLNQKEIVKIVQKYSSTKYDSVYTHGKTGEYGHIRHLDCNKAISKMLNSKSLKARKVFFFSYERKSNNYQGYATYNSNADILINLNREELLMKKKLVMDVYGFGGGGFEELSCGEVEAFDKK